VNLSLGTDQTSESVEQKLEEVKRQGIACIVAAGNSEGPVQYPARSGNVLAVAAIGKFGQYPADSFQATQMFVKDDKVPSTSEGYFSAKFTCFGPEIGICAPGVAILSSVPPNNFAAWDGTSVAAPHVTGLAALVLAHHPDFQGPYKTRNAQWVERLFQILKQSARLLDLGDRNRIGAGLPDALRALNVTSNVTFGVETSGPSDQVLQKLMQLLQSIQQQLRQGTQQSTATSSATSTGLNVDQLRDALQKAGLLSTAAGSPAGASAVGASSAGITPQSSTGVQQDVTLMLQQLRTAIEQTGLLSSNGSSTSPLSVAPQANEKGGADVGAIMQQLRTVLQQSGLL
jgi:Subtilase family